MATSGAYKNSPFYFTYSFVDSADPTSIYTGSVANTDITIYTRTTNGTPTIYPLNSGNPSTTVLSAGGVHTIALTGAEMNFDEIVLVCSGTGFVSENISICTEPAPSDILEVQSSAVTGVADFKATGFSTLVATDIVSDGNPITASSGTISNVATTGTVTDKAGYSISGTKTTLDALNDVAATDIVSAGPITTLSGAVVNVDTVDAVTDRTGYELTQTFPSNFADLIIGTGADLGKVTTSNPSTGSGSSHTAADVAALILDDPNNLLVTNASGQVEASNASDATAANQTTIINHLTDVKGTGWVAADNLAEIAEDVAGLNGDGVLDATAVENAVWDASYSSHTGPGTFGKLIDIFRKATTSTEGTVSGTPSPTAFDTNLTMSNDNFNDQLVVFTSGSLLGVSAPIADTAATNGRITLQEALPSAPAAGNEFIILSDHIHPVAEIQSGLATSAEVSTLSTFDPAVDAVANVTTVGSVTGSVGSVTDPVTTDAASRTASQADLTSITSDVADVKSVVDNILLDTGTDGVVISTAQAQAIADEVLRRSVSNVETAGDVSDTALEHTLATIVLSILNSQRSAGNWTIYKTDNATTHVSKTLTLDPTASPVTRVQ